MDKIIVTGCGRSGTQYMQLVLQSFGIDVGHEEWGKDGFVGFHVAADMKTAAVNRKDRAEASRDDVVLHQVRHPLPTISSLQTMQEYSWDFVSKYIPVDREDSTILSCMKYWYHWNLLAEGHARYTYQVEQMSKAWPTICKLIGLDASSVLPEETKKMYHRRGHTDLTLDDLKSADSVLYQKICGLAQRYGYVI